METLSPLAGKAAPREMLVDLNKLERFLHSFPFFTIPYRLCAENSVHKLATKNWGEPFVETVSISHTCV